MPHLLWERRPELRRPVLIAAFEGWNDAGEAATSAARWLATRTSARRFATLDPEEFYDFTVARPYVRLDEGLTRHIDWPTPTFEAARLQGDHDLVVLHSIEPSLRWRTFTEDVVSLCQEVGVQLVLTLGALLADVPHTRPVRVTGTAGTPELAGELGLQRSRYEGPTGIVGVLHDGCARAGLPSASLWAQTPHYLSQTPSPKAALALVERATALLGQRFDVTDLQIAAAAYERQVNETLDAETDVADYVRRLEQQLDEEGEEEVELPSPEALAAEVERFLRDHHDPNPD